MSELDAGAQAVSLLARRFKQLGQRELKNAMNRAIRQASAPLVDEVKANLRANLPHSGGLADSWLRTAKVSVRTRTGSNTAGVRITGSWSPEVDRTGRLRHPVYGNRQVWVTQYITPGLFSDPLRAGVPVVRPQLLRVLEDTMRKALRG